MYHTDFFPRATHGTAAWALLPKADGRLGCTFQPSPQDDRYSSSPSWRRPHGCSRPGGQPWEELSDARKSQRPTQNTKRPILWFGHVLFPNPSTTPDSLRALRRPWRIPRPGQSTKTGRGPEDALNTPPRDPGLIPHPHPPTAAAPPQSRSAGRPTTGSTQLLGPAPRPGLRGLP